MRRRPATELKKKKKKKMRGGCSTTTTTLGARASAFLRGRGQGGAGFITMPVTNWLVDKAISGVINHHIIDRQSHLTTHSLSVQSVPCSSPAQLPPTTHRPLLTYRPYPLSPGCHIQCPFVVSPHAFRTRKWYPWRQSHVLERHPSVSTVRIWSFRDSVYSQAMEIWKVLHSLLAGQPSKTIIGLGLPVVGTPNIELSTIYALSP